MKKTILILVIVIASLGVSQKSSAQSAVLGAALVKLGDQLQQAIDDAKNAGLNLEVEAGREVGLSLENFKNVYASSLNLTMDKLDTTATNQFEKIKTLVDEVQNNTVSSLDNFTAQAQQIINSLPFRKHEPQLTTTSPQYIVPSAIIYNMVISCKGNFEAAGIQGYTPTLTIGNTVYQASGTNQLLQFHVPISAFANDPGIMTSKFGYV